MRFLKTYHVFIFLIIGLTVFANNPREAYLDESIEVHAFDKEEWKNLTKDLDYSDEPEKEKKPEEKKPRQRNRSNDLAMAQVMKILAIIAAVALLVLFLANMMGAGNIFTPKNRKIKRTSTDIDLEEIEENIHEAEMDPIIQRAVNEGNYPLAIRLYYLAILKELSLDKSIKWKKDKTNGAYLRELRSSPYFRDFREVTLIFERIWYGKSDFVKADFENVQPKFQNLLNSIPESIASN